MGIIVSCFKGCGATYFTNLYGTRVKVLDKRGELKNDDVDEILNVVGNYDIVFISSDEKTRDLFNDRGIDYDVFYPSSERRGEFIENMVRKRVSPKEIQTLDKDFYKMVEELDNDAQENCYKHKLSEQGHFIGNDTVIMQYVDSLTPTANMEGGSNDKD